MQSAALEEQQVVFVVDHAWIAYLPEILNPIEAILEGSEIPNLFGDDLESLAKPLKNAAQQDGYQDSLASYFWTRSYPFLICVCEYSFNRDINLQVSSSDCTSSSHWKASVRAMRNCSQHTRHFTKALKSFGC